MYISESGKHLYQFYKEKEEVFHKNFKVINSEPTFHSIHDFRVSIKRIKAIFRLLDMISFEFNSKIQFKPYRSVFKPAGNIREVQVNRNTIKLYKLTPETKSSFTKYCDKKEGKSQLRLIEKLSLFDYDLAKNTKKLIKDSCKEISEDEVRMKTDFFIRERIEAIEKIASNSPDELSVHQARINLKEISAVIMLLKKMELQGFDKDILHKIKKTEDKLGDWHDKVVLELFIEKFQKKAKLTQQSVDELQNIRDSIAEYSNNFIEDFDAIITPTLKEIGQGVRVSSGNL